jgi:glycosyltransferase involved in cell wall biosynthesis
MTKNIIVKNPSICFIITFSRSTSCILQGKSEPIKLAETINIKIKMENKGISLRVFILYNNIKLVKQIYKYLTNMLKLLFVSHNPYIISGYGIQLYYLINKLYSSIKEVEIRVICFNQEGIETHINSPVLAKDYLKMREKNESNPSIIDKNSRMYNELLLYFNGKITYDIPKGIYWQKIHQIFLGYNCDKMIIFMDLWPFEKYNIHNISCEKYLWLPVHNNFLLNPLIKNNEFYSLETRNLWHLPYFTKIATFSQFGVSVLQSYLYDPFFLNHVVDKNFFYNTKNKKDLRKTYRINEDDYICLIVARNSESNDRKGYLSQFEAFAAFSKNKPNCKLLVHDNHTFSLDKGMTNLKEKARSLGILTKIVVTDSSFVPKERIRDLYNLSDVLLCASRSEGFGVPIVEAQFCDLLVITNKCTSMPENTYFGVSVEPEKISYIINNQNSWSDPSPEKIACVLEDFYNNQLDKYNIKPIPKEKYDIDNVFEDWKKFLNI